MRQHYSFFSRFALVLALLFIGGFLLALPCPGDPLFELYRSEFHSALQAGLVAGLPYALAYPAALDHAGAWLAGRSGRGFRPPVYVAPVARRVLAWRAKPRTGRRRTWRRVTEEEAFQLRELEWHRALAASSQNLPCDEVHGLADTDR